MSYALGSLILPDDPVWVDEFDWSPIVQSAEYSLTGALLVQEAVKLAGRPITLDLAWLTRTQMQALAALADVAGAEYPLNIYQGSYTVIFRRPPYTVKPIQELADPNGTDFYEVTVNLQTV